MIHANYINNNIPGSKRSALVHCPGFAELQPTPRDELLGKRQGKRREPDRGGRQSREKSRRSPLRARGRARSDPQPREHLCPQPPRRPSRETPATQQVATQQAGGTACLEKPFSLCNAAAHQHLSKSPALASSSLPIYPPFVSANNRALSIYSIFRHLAACRKTSLRASKPPTWAPPPPPERAPGPSAWVPSKSADGSGERGVTPAPKRP